MKAFINTKLNYDGRTRVQVFTDDGECYYGTDFAYQVTQKIMSVVNIGDEIWVDEFGIKSGILNYLQDGGYNATAIQYHSLFDEQE